MAELQPPVALENVATLHADDFRNLIKTLVPTEGVAGAGDLAVTANGTPNMTVIVAAGGAFIQGDDTPTTQGTYYVKNDAAVTLTIGAANATNPRIDIVIAEVRDTQYGAAADDWRLRVVAGTAAASPTAPALPSNSLKLATISVPALDTTISQAQITDERSFAAFGGLSTSIPAGFIGPYAGASAPSGWLLCDGAAVSRSTYSALYAAISNTYGAGDGTTTFNVPNLKGRVPIGRDVTVAAVDTLAETGGSKDAIAVSHNHTQDAHDHTAFVDVALVGGAHYHDNTIGVASPPSAPSSSASVSSVVDNTPSTATNQAAGSSGTNANLPPYLVLNYIVKAT